MNGVVTPEPLHELAERTPVVSGSEQGAPPGTAGGGRGKSFQRRRRLLSFTVDGAADTWTVRGKDTLQRAPVTVVGRRLRLRAHPA